MVQTTTKVVGLTVVTAVHDCVSGTYDCASYGGTCDDCIDPATSDFSEGGACYEEPPVDAPVAIQACTDYYK